MLNEDLQVQLKQLLAHINAQYEDLVERANRPNFELIYDDVLVHPEKQDTRLVSVLNYHDDECVAKLTFICYQDIRLWEVTVKPVFADVVFTAYDSSDAIRLAQKEIKARESEFLDYYAADKAPESIDESPTPNPKHQGGEL